MSTAWKIVVAVFHKIPSLISDFQSHETFLQCKQYLFLWPLNFKLWMPSASAKNLNAITSNEGCNMLSKFIFKLLTSKYIMNIPLTHGNLNTYTEIRIRLFKKKFFWVYVCKERRNWLAYKSCCLIWSLNIQWSIQ